MKEVGDARVATVDGQFEALVEMREVSKLVQIFLNFAYDCLDGIVTEFVSANWTA